MNRRILVEMATYKESEVFAQEPVASASTKDVESLEDDKLREYVYNRIGNVGNTISEHDIGVLIKHHCGNRLRKKTALLTLPYVINANYIIHPWRRQTNNGEIIKGKDKRLSGMVGAPILIDGTKYLCNISLKKSANGKVRPYALTLKDGNGNIVENEKMDSTLQVPDSNSEPTTSGNAHFDKVTTSPDTNPSTNANIDKNNKTDKNESKNMSKKNTINEARRPSNKQVGQHLFKGLRYDNNGNPLYTCDTLSNEEAQAMGWKFSPKYGLYGQLSDPTMFYESKKNTIRLTESDLKRVISESVKRVLKEGLGKRPYSDITDINVSINSMVDMLEKVSETYSGELDDETRNMIAEIDNHFNEASELVYRLYYKLAFGQEPSYYNGGSEQHDYSGLSGWGA